MMTELRSRTRGGERWGQSSRNAEATTQEVERKRKEAEARHTATNKNEPDGLILDKEEKMTYIIEGARCSDADEAMETA
jgi:hypothetical protein